VGDREALGADGFRAVVLRRGFFRDARFGFGCAAVFLGMLCPSCCELTTTPPTKR
jgi:hypothetical protein